MQADQFHSSGRLGGQSEFLLRALAYNCNVYCMRLAHRKPIFWLNQRFGRNSFVNYCFETNLIILIINFFKAFDSAEHSAPFYKLNSTGLHLALFSALNSSFLINALMWFSKSQWSLFLNLLRCFSRIFLSFVYSLFTNALPASIPSSNSWPVHSNNLAIIWSGLC